MRFPNYSKKNPINFIDSYFNNLKSEINLKGSNMIKKIDGSLRKGLVEVEIFKEECTKNAKQKTLTVNNFGKSYEKKLKEWYDILKIPNFDNQSKWKEIKQEADREIRKLFIKLKESEDELLLNKNFVFEKNDFVDFNIGCLKTKEVI